MIREIKKLRGVAGTSIACIGYTIAVSPSGLARGPGLRYVGSIPTAAVLGSSFNGRTLAFGVKNWGSSPCEPV